MFFDPGEVHCLLLDLASVVKYVDKDSEIYSLPVSRYAVWERTKHRMASGAECILHLHAQHIQRIINSDIPFHLGPNPFGRIRRKCLRYTESLDVPNFGFFVSGDGRISSPT